MGEHVVDVGWVVDGWARFHADAKAQGNVRHVAQALETSCQDRR